MPALLKAMKTSHPINSINKYNPYQNSSGWYYVPQWQSTPLACMRAQCVSGSGKQTNKQTSITSFTETEKEVLKFIRNYKSPQRARVSHHTSWITSQYINIRDDIYITCHTQGPGVALQHLQSVNKHLLQTYSRQSCSVGVHANTRAGEQNRGLGSDPNLHNWSFTRGAEDTSEATAAGSLVQWGPRVQDQLGTETLLIIQPINH